MNKLRVLAGSMLILALILVVSLVIYLNSDKNNDTIQYAPAVSPQSDLPLELQAKNNEVMRAGENVQ